MPADLPVTHDIHARQFFTEVPEGRAELAYEVDMKTIVITHTFVSPSLRGRGIAEMLTRAALEWVRRNDLNVRPQCSYAARFIERHAEFQSLLATGS